MKQKYTIVWHSLLFSNIHLTLAILSHVPRPSLKPARTSVLAQCMDVSFVVLFSVILAGMWNYCNHPVVADKKKGLL